MPSNERDPWSDIIPVVFLVLVLAVLVKVVFFSDIAPRVTEPARECKTIDDKYRVIYKACED